MRVQTGTGVFFLWCLSTPVECRAVCLCVLHPFCWWSLTGITTRPKLYFLLDSCRCTTSDLRNAALAAARSNRCTNAHIHIFMFFWWATRGYECCFLWALSFINIFIELNKLLTFCGVMNSLHCFGQIQVLAEVTWHQSKLFNLWFAECLFSRWKHLIPLSVFQHFSSFSSFFFFCSQSSLRMLLYRLWSAGLSCLNCVFQVAELRCDIRTRPQFKLPFITSSHWCWHKV